MANLKNDVESSRLIRSDENSTSYFSLNDITTPPIVANDDLFEHDIFSKTNLLRECFSLLLSSIPVIASCFLEFLNPFITIYSVGWLGKEELASAAISQMFAGVTGWSFAAGMTTALDTLCSQAYTGSNNIKMVGVYAQRGFLVTMVLFVPISFSWLNAESFLLLIGQEEKLAKLSGAYLSWLLLAIPPYIGFECVKKYLQAQGIMKAPAKIMIFNTPVCMILNYLLVWHKPTSLGFVGAPLATALTNWSCFIFSLLYVIFVDGKQCWGGFSMRAFTEWGAFIKLGIPGVVMVCSGWWAYEVMSLSASYLGSAPLAAHAAMISFSSLLYQVSYGTGTVASNRVGNYLGGGSPNKAKLASVSSLIVGASLGLTSCLTVLSLTPYLKVFYSDDPEVIYYVSTIIPAMAVLQIGEVSVGAAEGILRGIGRQDIGAKLNLFVYYCIAIPFGLLLTFYFKMGIQGLWIGFALGSFIIASFSIVLCLKANWQMEADNAKNRIQE